ncbi:hypothetical protein I6N90_03320 [Paenibacillus sp. GSMTC-2017]|uniref:hypothetical protein n=1 Tax=Paenibacillus sp. GSMTC-2017 TaxID=2794350 RepID=UPI0018D87D99|nr:hypothetical protein [Paenibacillus sp. GSMTC-2017]MBH5316840.1 hypothetical protein [Paenibacillus sp. GSMTC-2017]
MKTKDVIYMIYNEKEQSVTSMGIKFNDFVTSLTIELNNVLLLASQYTGEDYHTDLRLEFVRKEHLIDLYKENVYDYGDFCWVDFDEITSLDNLEPQEKAELLYLEHYKKALSNPFSDKLNNKYVYLAHDDGWYNKVIYKDINEFINILRQLIPNRLSMYKKSMERLGLDVVQQLVRLAKDGILIELYRCIKSKNSIEIPFSIIGKILDFDDVYNNMERHKAKANSEFWLVFKNKQWAVKSYR